MKKISIDKVMKLYVTFVKVEEGMTLYPWQLELSKMLFTSLFITKDDVFIKVARQSGKTETVTLVVKFLIIFHEDITGYPLMFGIASPTGEQAKTDIDRIKKSIPELRKSFSLQDKEFNAHTIRAYIADVLQAEGFKFSLRPTASNESKTLNLLVVEEAHKTNDKKRADELDPMLSSTNGPTWYIGVGNVRNCDFLKGCNGELPDSQSLVVDAYRVIEEKEAMYKKDNDPMHLAYKAKFDTLLRKYGKANPEIVRNYLVEDTVEEGNFISAKRFDAMGRDSGVQVSTNELYMGLDWARSHDNTWLILFNEYNDIVDMFKIAHARYEEQIEMIMIELNKNRGTDDEPWTFRDRIMAVRGDSTGQGDMPMEQMQKQNLPINEDSKVKFTLQSKHAMYSALQDIMFKDEEDPYRFSFPKDHPLAGELKEQMVNLVKEHKGDGEYLSVHHPNDDPNGRDDAPDACALAVYGKTNQTLSDIIIA